MQCDFLIPARKAKVYFVSHFSRLCTTLLHLPRQAEAPTNAFITIYENEYICNLRVFGQYVRIVHKHTVQLHLEANLNVEPYEKYISMNVLKIHILEKQCPNAWVLCV